MLTQYAFSILFIDKKKAKFSNDRFGFKGQYLVKLQKAMTFWHFSILNFPNSHILYCELLLSGKTFQTKQIRADTSHEVSALLVIFVFAKLKHNHEQI